MADSSKPDSSTNDDLGKTQAVPEKGCLLGIDYGTKRVGLAVSDSRQSIASPIENYTLSDPQANERFFRKVVDEYAVVGVVVGLPVHLQSGDEGEVAAAARDYGQWLHETVERPICFWDERMTSQIADEAMVLADFSPKQRKKRLDMVAAQVMLQSFLDAPDRSKAPGSYQ